MASNNSAPGSGQPVRILIINPNSSQDMTKGMMAAIEEAQLGSTIQLSSYTGPASAPASINDDAGIKASDEAVYAEAVQGKIKFQDYDAVLVACYSVHTLVTRLQNFGRFAITGIFEASICTAQLLLRPHSDERWGIVTTGKFWEDHLSAGFTSFLGQDPNTHNQRFAGVFTTGLNAGDFHTMPEEEVTQRLRDTTRRLLTSGNVKCVVMGCAGMAGLERVIRSTAEEMYGADAAKQLYVVDGVKAGVLQLEQAVRSIRIFGQ